MYLAYLPYCHNRVSPSASITWGYRSITQRPFGPQKYHKLTLNNFFQKSLQIAALYTFNVHLMFSVLVMWSWLSSRVNIIIIALEGAPWYIFFILGKISHQGDHFGLWYFATANVVEIIFFSERIFSLASESCSRCSNWLLPSHRRFFQI